MSTSSSSSTSKKPLSQRLVPFPQQNRFSPLTPDKKPLPYTTVLQNTNSKLITPFPSQTQPIQSVSPFSKKQAIQTSPIIPKSKSSYITNPNLQKVQILEDFHIDMINQGFHILTNYLFGHGKTFYSDAYKNREYYQTILESSGSVRFTHTSNQQERNIDYSKAHILKIITPQNWGNPHAQKPLPFLSYPSYSYYDYQEAWFKVFLLRNFSHSWFIFFDKNFDYQYPRWFVHWYLYMGLSSHCFPPEVFKGFSKFKQLFVQEIPEFEYALQFSMAFKIPWIMSWTYHFQEAKALHPPWLNRQYRIKWWDKFKNDQANEISIQQYYQTTYQSSTSTQESIAHNGTNLIEPDLVARIIGAAGSSKEELTKLIHDIRSSPPESECSPSGSVKNEAFQNIQDAQDPFEDPYED